MLYFTFEEYLESLTVEKMIPHGTTPTLIISIP